MALADRANQYIDERKPWILAKQAGAEAEVVAVCTLGLNLFRALIVYLKPIVPALAARAESLLAGGELRWHDAAIPLLGTPHRQVRGAADARRAGDRRSIRQAGSERHARPPRKPAGNGAPHERRQSISREFQKTELRVARVIEASYVDGADKLLQLRLDVGGEERTVFSGIRSSL